RELVVRQHAVRHVTPKAGDGDLRTLRLADHEGRSPSPLGEPPGSPRPRPPVRCSYKTLSVYTANVSVARHASSPATRASTLPRPTGPRTCSSSQRSSSVSPGLTMR